mgnify:CR=1 FL=1
MFNVQKYSSADDQQWMAGTSSLLQRKESAGETEQVHVQAVRLDNFLRETDADINNKRIALWIDAEGAAYQVMEGISDIASRMLFIQVEVETGEIWQGQQPKKMYFASYTAWVSSNLARANISNNMI